VREREKPLRQLVRFTLADLIGLDGHQRVVAALGLHGHAQPADGAGERPLAGAFRDRRETRAEVPGGEAEDVVGRGVGAVEILHSSVSSMNCVKREA
jgi:hypothetical protein